MQTGAVLVAVLVLFGALEVFSKKHDNSKHRNDELKHRFPKPKHWMLYSSDYDASKERDSACFDKRPQCGTYARNDQYCVYAGYFMKRNCRRTCKYCEVNIGRQEALAEPFPNSGCEDSLEDCGKYFQSQEQCNLFSGASKKYCTRTCGFCCTDRIPDCEVFVRDPKQCSGLNGFWKKYCPRTCRLCGSLLPPKKPGCVDELADCSLFANTKRQCNKHQSFCAKYCAKSCGLCDNSKATVSPTEEPTAVTEALTTMIVQATKSPSPMSPPSNATAEVMKKASEGFLSGSSKTEPPMTAAPFTKPSIPHVTQMRAAPAPPVASASPGAKSEKTRGKLRQGSCIDKLVECTSFIKRFSSACVSHVKYMKEYCPHACGYCDGEEKPTVPTTGDKPIPECRDKRKKCRMYSKIQGYCTFYEQFTRINCAKSCGYCNSAPIMKPKYMESRTSNQKKEFEIKTTWDGKTITHAPYKFRLTALGSYVRLKVSGPLFNDPPAPPKCASKLPCWKLWEYEVAEVFFLGRGEKYLEVELSPHGMYLVLLLDGVRKPFKTKLPMKYTATIDNDAKEWMGVARIPIEYFPPGVHKMNAFAIHGSGEKRAYEALYPATNLPGPDFHALQFFKDFDFKSMFGPGWRQGQSPFWIKS